MENKSPCADNCVCWPDCVSPCDEQKAWAESESKIRVEKPTTLVMSVRDNKILHITTVLARVKTMLLGDWNEEDPKKLISKALEVLYTEAGIETFNEIFAKFDAWYWDKYRHHPEKMVVEQFYKFLNKEAV